MIRLDKYFQMAWNHQLETKWWMKKEHTLLFGDFWWVMGCISNSWWVGNNLPIEMPSEKGENCWGGYILPTSMSVFII